MSYWLLKSEPDVFGIDTLKKQRTAVWDGVRNYQARNYLRTAAVDDLAFFYHSNTAVMGVAGLCKIVETGVVDPTQFDSKSQYFDPKSTPAAPRWQTVKVQYVETFPAVYTLDMLEKYIYARRAHRGAQGQSAVRDAGIGYRRKKAAYARAWMSDAGASP